MAFFRDKTHYSRSDAMERAAKAAGRGRKKKAIEEYRKVLANEPENAAVLTKVAVLLAETRRYPEAWKGFLAAAESWKKQGFVDRQYAVYRQAADYMPREPELWETLARIDLERGRAPDAVKVLLEGRKHFRKKKLRPFAVRLLRLATKIEPWHFEATFDLAALMRKEGDKREARRLLEGLVERARGRRLRRVRGALFSMSPTPAAAWRWTRAAVRGR
ncbi:MAG TPA: hypothetical protein VMV18_04615 [bacterium]|nr:hypothetical protein [bacterium]